MKANELRVGNHYYYHIVDELDKRKEWDEICIIDAADIEFLVENPDDKDFKPIPLTDKILEKCGFAKYGDKYGTKCGSTILLLTSPNTMGEWQKCFCWVYDNYKFTEVHFLHQLENLYFALTAGKELEIKL